MPFDGQNWTAPEAKPVDLESLPVDERRRMFCEALRGKMPEGFEWDYAHQYHETNCGSSGCAIGLAQIRTGRQWCGTELGRWLGIGRHAGQECFYRAWRHCGVSYNDVTPSMVADLIEKFAAEQAPRCELGEGGRV